MWTKLFILLITSFKFSGANTLLVVSFDGFRNEYLQRGLTPNFLSLRSNGVSVPYLQNIFPTKTFPEHFSIATGLYSGNHGVVNTEVLDSKEGRLKYGYPLFHYSNSTTPIWTLNELQGGTSGCMMFAGSQFPYQNKNCSYVEPFTPSLEFEKSVKMTFEWIKNPTKPPNLVMSYFSEPDRSGHIYGPDSEQMNKTLQRMDYILGLIREEIRTNKLQDRLNLVIVSDHGMAAVPPTNIIDLTQAVGNDSCTFYGNSPVIQIVPNPGKYDFVLNKLKKLSKANGHFRVFTNTEIPVNWHYTNDQRIGPISVVADVGYGFSDLQTSLNYYKEHYNVTVTNDTKIGVHGYENNQENMWGIFMAEGPDLKTNFVAQPTIQNIDLYHLFSKLLHLTPPKIDGNPEHIEQLLKVQHSNAFPVVFSAALTLLLFAIVVAVIWAIRRRGKLQQFSMKELEIGNRNPEETAKLISIADNNLVFDSDSDSANKL